MAEQIVIEFTADISKLQPAIDALESLGQIDKKSADIFRATNEAYKSREKEVTKLTQAYDNLSKEVAAGGMQEHAKDVEKTTQAIVQQKEQTENLTKKLRQMVRELAAMKAEGRDNTEQFRQMSREAGKLADDIGDAREQVKVLSSDTKRLDAVAGAFRGLAAGMSIATGASALLGDENKDLQKTLLQVQSAMAILTGVQEVATLVTGQNALKTMVLDGAQKAVAVSARLMGTSVATATAVMTAGISLVVAGVAYLVTQLTNATDETGRVTDEMLEKQKNLLSAQQQITDLRISLIKDERKRALAEQQTAEKRELVSLTNRFRAGQMTAEQYEELYTLTKLKGEQDRLDIEAKFTKKSQDNKKKAQRENYDFLLETNRDMVAAEEKMLSEIMGLQAKELQNQRDIDAENEKWQEDEINKALLREKQAADARIKIAEDEAERKKQIQKQLNEAIIAASFQAFQDIANAAFEIDENRREARLNSELNFLTKQRDALLANEALTDAQRESIDRRYEQRKRKAQIEAWKSGQQAAVAQAIINGALAIGNALATVKPFPAAIVAAASVAVSTAAQTAVIRSQPMPQFAEGTEFVEGAGTGTSDSITAKLSRGERVVTAKTNSDYFDALSVIHNRLVAPELVNTLLTNLAENGGMIQTPSDKITELENEKGGIDYDKLGEAMKKGRSVVNIEMNERGFVKHIQRGLNSSTYHNNKLRLRA